MLVTDFCYSKRVPKNMEELFSKYLQEVFRKNVKSLDAVLMVDLWLRFISDLKGSLPETQQQRRQLDGHNKHETRTGPLHVSNN